MGYTGLERLQIVRVLTRGELVEKSGVFRQLWCDPCTVVLEDVFRRFLDRTWDAVVPALWIHVESKVRWDVRSIFWRPTRVLMGRLCVNEWWMTQNRWSHASHTLRMAFVGYYNWLILPEERNDSSWLLLAYGFFVDKRLSPVGLHVLLPFWVGLSAINHPDKK